MYAEVQRPRPRHVPLPTDTVTEEYAQDGLWLMPSRARETRAMDAMRASADAGQSTPGLLIQDGCKYFLPRLPAHWTAIQLAEHHELAGAIHAAWNQSRGKAWYGIISDGVRPVTKGWDRLMLAASADKNFVSCNDNWRRDSRMAGILLVPGWIVEALGYFFPAGMVHLWTDDIWEQLGQALDNWVYVPDVTVEDHHFAHPNERNKVAFDMPRQFKGRMYGNDDKRLFLEWRNGPEFDFAVQRIKDAWTARTGKDWNG